MDQLRQLCRLESMHSKSQFLRISIFATAFVAPAIVSAERIATDYPSYQLRVMNPQEYQLRGPEYPVATAAPAAPRQSVGTDHLATMPYAPQIDRAARNAALDPGLVHAIIYVESRHNAAARSSKGAVGLMQVLPETASRYGILDPGQSLEANLRAGTLYLSRLLQMFEGRLDLALAAYNAGENAVIRYGQRIPPFRETQLYVPAVLAKYNEWKTVPSPGPATHDFVPVAKAVARHVDYLPGTRLDSNALRATSAPTGE